MLCFTITCSWHKLYITILRALDTRVYLSPSFLMRKKKTLTRKDYVKQLDNIFSTYIRLRDSNKEGVVVCPLCWARVNWKQAQNMHFITRWCWKYRYDEDNCHAGCMRCNVILHGNYIIYTRWMQNNYGIKKVDEMIRNKIWIYKIPTPELQKQIEYYTRRVEKLYKTKVL